MAYALTLIGAKGLDDSNIEDIKNILNSDHIIYEQVLSDNKAIDIILSQAPTNEVFRAIREYVYPRQIDYAFQRSDNRKKKLIVADMESTIIKDELLDDLSDLLGLREEVSAITEEGMQGKIDFKESVNKRVALLKGLSIEQIQEITKHVQLTGGAKTLVATMKDHGAITALVSGGFLSFIEGVSEECCFDYCQGNDFIIEDNCLTGKVKMPILDKTSKRQALLDYAKKHNIEIECTMAVGDGANDLLMIKEAGTGVSFQTIRTSLDIDEESDVTIKFNDLTALLYIQGYKEEDFK